MARTTDELVGGVIEVDEGIDLAPFIDVANQLVTELCTSSDYSDERLTSIETWLAAHFYAVRDPRSTREEAGSIRDTYESKVDLGLNITRYGQQAMMLDTKGNLAALNNANQKIVTTKRTVTWLGTDYD